MRKSSHGDPGLAEGGYRAVLTGLPRSCHGANWGLDSVPALRVPAEYGAFQPIVKEKLYAG